MNARSSRQWSELGFSFETQDAVLYRRLKVKAGQPNNPSEVIDALKLMMHSGKITWWRMDLNTPHADYEKWPCELGIESKDDPMPILRDLLVRFWDFKPRDSDTAATTVINGSREPKSTKITPKPNQ